MAFSLFDAVIFQSKPSVGRATCAAVFRRRRFAFQSKPSVGRATTTGMKQQQKMSHFNPRPPWGGRRVGEKVVVWVPRLFQSTPSVGRATEWQLSREFELGNFNPRPPWGGRREVVAWQSRRISDFNPRPPWGGRRMKTGTNWATLKFQSTPSVGRATTRRENREAEEQISIHALRGEGDDEP